MHACSVTYGNVKMDWDQYGNLVLARTDVAESIRLSVSEWAFLVKLNELQGWPVAAPSQPQTMPT